MIEVLQEILAGLPVETGKPQRSVVKSIELSVCSNDRAPENKSSDRIQRASGADLSATDGRGHAGKGHAHGCVLREPTGARSAPMACRHHNCSIVTSEAAVEM
ncbi:MAG: hypothetical protein NW223_15405 [Hyphomicrobiaceae bacterium]|nr:hypothetical protein [Hyphomicrobiaceae bacterium]